MCRLRKKTKIYILIMILLVMLTNVSYSVTFNFCNMSSMSNCSCKMNDESSAVSLNKVSCCKEEVKNISNNVDFTKLNDKIQNPEIVLDVYKFTESINLSNYLSPKENLIFLLPKRDLSVQYSRLLI